MSVFNNIHVHLFLTAWESLTPARWRLQNLQDSFWRLYTHNGSGAAIEINGETFQLEKDRLYFIPAGVRFDTFAAKTVGQFYIHFDLVG
ncbi:MAG TPA: hypothetical protein VHV83_12590 [Armatimonadota bacterium]|nr:hypothetical protein [Armatimonadota bacterium]